MRNENKKRGGKGGEEIMPYSITGLQQSILDLEHYSI